MLRWKNTVDFTDLHPAMVLASVRIDQIYGFAGQADCWITSGNDGKHKPGSKHYLGRAFDIRTKVFPSTVVKRTVESEIRRALGPFYYVELEDLGGPNEHIHVQWNGRPISPPLVTT